jgi:hypothetical protein
MAFGVEEALEGALYGEFVRTILDSLHLCGLWDFTSTPIYPYEKWSM